MRVWGITHRTQNQLAANVIRVNHVTLAPARHSHESLGTDPDAPTAKAPGHFTQHETNTRDCQAAVGRPPIRSSFIDEVYNTVSCVRTL